MAGDSHGLYFGCVTFPWLDQLIAPLAAMQNTVSDESRSWDYQWIRWWSWLKHNRKACRTAVTDCRISVVLRIVHE